MKTLIILFQHITKPFFKKIIHNQFNNKVNINSRNHNNNIHSLKEIKSINKIFHLNKAQ